ncbi:MAG: hypothetical protein ACI8ZM_005349, partial [Crocinitomix sp.]
MITTILSLTLFAIFTLLAVLHVYWLFGGKWALEKAIPSSEDGEKVFNPWPIATTIVSGGLALFGLFYLLKSDLIHIDLPNWIIVLGGWLIPAIFILRAIGDFNYLGFFKKIKHT